MRHFRIPMGMGLEEFALSRFEGRPARKGPLPEESAPDQASRKALRKRRKAEYVDAEPEIPEAPSLKPLPPAKEEEPERSITPLMPPSTVPHQALPPLMPSPSDEVFAEPDIPPGPVLREDIEEGAEYERAEEEVDAMVPEMEIVDEGEGKVAKTSGTDSAVKESRKKWFMSLSQAEPGEPPAESKGGAPSVEGEPSLLPVILILAGVVAVGVVVYTIKNPEILQKGA